MLRTARSCISWRRATVGKTTLSLQAKSWTASFQKLALPPLAGEAQTAAVRLDARSGGGQVTGTYLDDAAAVGAVAPPAEALNGAFLVQTQ